MTIYRTRRLYSEREKASPELIEKAKKEGVVQKVGDSWRIVAIKKGTLWPAHYISKERAAAALRGYQAQKHMSLFEKNYSFFGKLRESLSRKVNELEDSEKKLELQARRFPKNYNSSLRKKLEDEASKNGGVILNKPGSGLVHPLSIRPTKKNLELFKKKLSNETDPEKIKAISELINIFSDDKVAIFWNDYHGNEGLAHEIGHTMNYKTGSVLDKLINKAHHISTNQVNKTENTVINALVDLIFSRAIIWEERNASKKAIELLRKHGLSGEELDRAKQLLGLSLEMYKIDSRKRWRSKLAGSQILSK